MSVRRTSGRTRPSATEPVRLAPVPRLDRRRSTRARASAGSIDRAPGSPSTTSTVHGGSPAVQPAAGRLLLRRVAAHASSSAREAAGRVRGGASSHRSAGRPISGECPIAVATSAPMGASRAASSLDGRRARDRRATSSLGSLDGSGESAGRSRTQAVRQPAAAAPTTSAAQSSPTWRIACGAGSPSAARAAAKIAAWGLITPTRWLTTIAVRAASSHAPPHSDRWSPPGASSRGSRAAGPPRRARPAARRHPGPAGGRRRTRGCRRRSPGRSRPAR